MKNLKSVVLCILFLCILFIKVEIASAKAPSWDDIYNDNAYTHLFDGGFSCTYEILDSDNVKDYGYYVEDSGLEKIIISGDNSGMYAQYYKSDECTDCEDFDDNNLYEAEETEKFNLFENEYMHQTGLLWVRTYMVPLVTLDYTNFNYQNFLDSLRNGECFGKIYVSVDTTRDGWFGFTTEASVTLNDYAVFENTEIQMDPNINNPDANIITLKEESCIKCYQGGSYSYVWDDTYDKNYCVHSDDPISEDKCNDLSVGKIEDDFNWGGNSTCVRPNSSSCSKIYDVVYASGQKMQIQLSRGIHYESNGGSGHDSYCISAKYDSDSKYSHGCSPVVNGGNIQLLLEKKNMLVLKKEDIDTLFSNEKYVHAITLEMDTAFSNSDSYNGYYYIKLAPEDVEPDYENNYVPPDNNKLYLCNENGVKQSFQIIGYLLFALKIAIPLILMGLGILDFSKALISEDDKVTKETAIKFAKRIISGVIIFFIPTILNFIFSLVDDIDKTTSKYEGCTACLFNPMDETKCSFKKVGFTEDE